MDSLPPGPRYVLSQLPKLLVPPAVVYFLSYLMHAHLHLAMPTWLLTVSYAFSWPMAFTTFVQWHVYTNTRRARALRAAIPREVEHRWPGSLDLLWKKDRTGYMGEWLFRWLEVYGSTFNFRVMSEDTFITTEPEYIKKILSTDFSRWENGRLLYEQLHTLLGSGVFNSDGDMFHRELTRPFFNRDRITHFDIFDRHAECALDKMVARLREGVPVDWQDVASRFTMDSATEFLFGRNVHSLNAPLPYPSTYSARTLITRAASDLRPNASEGDEVHPANRFVRAFQDALRATGVRTRFVQSTWPLFEFWGDKVKQYLKAVDDFIDPIVEEALRAKAEKVSGGGVDAEGKEQARDDETLLEHLVKFMNDPKVIKDETLNILLAGRDTTACTLTFAVYSLIEHPEVMTRLRKEVLSVVGSSQRPTYDHIREMKYMRAFINEVLRLWPPVPFASKCSIEPMIWKSVRPGEPDIYIPPRSRCVYSFLIMHRRKDLWGPDALMFDPDRFLDERLQKYLVANPFIFLPFNAGPRICLGKQFAYNEISVMLVRLLQRFSSITLRQDVHPAAVPPPNVEYSPYAVDGRERVWTRNHLTTYVKNGLWVEMEEAPHD
ncbi:cytochrome P450 [Trametes punicea]|nr:cytochrome P450 [Trametes punicea]